MIVKMPGGFLRDLIPTVMSFSKDNFCPLNSSDCFTTKDHLPGWGGLSDSDNGMFLPTACTFKVFSMETYLFDTDPSAFMKTHLRFQVGEKVYADNPLIGPVTEGRHKLLYRNFRLDIDPKNEKLDGCDTTEDIGIQTFNSFVWINPLQSFSLKVLEIPENTLMKLQVNLVGFLLRPVA